MRPACTTTTTGRSVSLIPLRAPYNQSISSLIDREYMRRSEEAANVYEYLA